jgi:hypothetical protein
VLVFDLPPTQLGGGDPKLLVKNVGVGPALNVCVTLGFNAAGVSPDLAGRIDVATVEVGKNMALAADPTIRWPLELPESRLLGTLLLGATCILGAEYDDVFGTPASAARGLRLRIEG